MDANSLQVNILVTVLVFMLVFLLPLADRRVCRKLRLNLEGGLSENPDADRLLQRRQRLLCLGFAGYLALFAWLVFFSRTSSAQFSVHVAPLEDLKNAFSTPTGFTGWFRTLFTEGFASAFSQISLVRPEDLSQFYLNIVLFVPMGYLLPYVSRWFRARVRIRPVFFCLLLSFLVENLQLITRRGLYDFDDIIANTLGGWIGQLLYILVGYWITHSGWRREMRAFRSWRRHARSGLLYPYTKKAGLSRTTLRGSDGAAVCEFYRDRLGFRLRQQLVRRESGDEVFLFEMGRNQIQIICSPFEPVPQEQYLTFFTSRLPALRRRLAQKGMTAEYRRDPTTERRLLRLAGPDHVRIEILESD